MIIGCRYCDDASVPLSRHNSIHKGTGKFIGRCGLLPWTIDGQNEVEVAYLIDKAYWGLGLGTEAAQAILHYGFEQLRLSRLICLVDQENQASIKVARNIGMAFEKEGKDEKGPFLLYSSSGVVTSGDALRMTKGLIGEKEGDGDGAWAEG